MKVIFFEIDGTLTDFEGNIPESAIKAIRRTRKSGNKVALCSGRSENQIDPYILDIGFDAIVSAAGATVTVGGNKIFSSTIGEEDYAFLLKVLKEPVPNVAVQTDEKVYLSLATLAEMDGYSARVMGGKPGRAKSKEELLADAKESVGELVLTDDLSHVKEPQKLFYHNANAPVEEVEKALEGRFTVQQLSFGPPNPYAGEITLKGIEKSTGMEALMNHYGLERTDAIAFGDGPNDMDMIAYAGLGICMGNGRDELKAIADYVTADVGKDGIYQALEHFELL